MMKGLSIEGNSFVPQEIIKNLVPDTLFLKEKGKIKLKDIRLNIEKYPFVKNADVMFSDDDSIDVVIKVRQPIAQIVDSTGKLWLTDDAGKILPYLFFENFSHLPLLSNCLTNKDSGSLKKDFCLAFLQKLNGEYQIIGGLLSQIIFNGDDIQLILKKSGARVIIGDTLNLDEKLNNLSVFLKAQIQQSDERKLKTIDLRWSKQVVVQKSK